MGQNRKNRIIHRNYLTSSQVESKLGISVRCQQYWQDRHLTSVKCDQEGCKGQEKRMYFFEDIVQLKAIKSLRDQGVTLREIGKAIERMKDHRGLPENPLVKLCIATDGKRIFIKEADGKVWDIVTGQGTLFSYPFKKIFQETAKVIKLPENHEELRIKDVFKRSNRSSGI
jgi:DNA-binding transcriptional MerR regulator